MKITVHHHEIAVELCVRTRRWSWVGVDLPEAGWETRTGLATMVGLAGAGLGLTAFLAAGISWQQGHALGLPELLALLVVIPLPLGAPLWLWLLSGTAIGPRRGYRIRRCTLTLDSAGARLDGRRCEIELAGESLVTKDGQFHALAETPHELRELGDLLAQMNALALEGRGQPRDIPAALRALRETR